MAFHFEGDFFMVHVEDEIVGLLRDGRSIVVIDRFIRNDLVSEVPYPWLHVFDTEAEKELKSKPE